MSDYVRQMPHQDSQDLARPPGTANRMHIDVPLLLLLLRRIVLLPGHLWELLRRLLLQRM